MRRTYRPARGDRFRPRSTTVDVKLPRPIEQAVRGVLLDARRGEIPGNPITHPAGLAMKLQELCGAEGYRIEGDQVLALRWDLQGNEHVIDRFELARING